LKRPEIRWLALGPTPSRLTRVDTSHPRGQQRPDRVSSVAGFLVRLQLAGSPVFVSLIPPRGFLGDYDIEVKSGGKSKTAHATLSKDGSRVEYVID
jgi:hypothetical protein